MGSQHTWPAKPLALVAGTGQAGPSPARRCEGVAGAEAASHTLESEAENGAELAAKYARAKKKGTAQLARIAGQESKMRRGASKLVEGAGYAFSTKEA